jgi:hypothetical protein
VPTVLIEMGFMTNPEEDEKLSDAVYLDSLVQGAVNGINLYLAVQAEETEAEAAVYLPHNAQLYEFTDGKLIRTSSSLTPQTVQIVAKRGAWAKVDTWLGQRWIHVGPTPVE